MFTLTSGARCWALGAYDGPGVIVFDVIPLLVRFLQSVFPAYTWVPTLQQYLQERGRGKNNEMIDDRRNQGKRNERWERDVVDIKKKKTYINLHIKCINICCSGYLPCPPIPYLYDQCLIRGPGWYEALRSVIGSLVLKNGSGDGVSARPVHRPVSVQIVASLGVPDGQIGAGRVQFHHADTPSPRRDGDHPVVLWERGQNLFQYLGEKSFKTSQMKSLNRTTLTYG